MPRLRQTALLASLLSLLIYASWLSPQNQPLGVRSLRWTEGQSGCTFSADDDGKYRYGLWTDDFGIVLAVDADEVRKTTLRIEPAFAIFLTVRYRGKKSLSVAPDNITLEFVKHYHDTQKTINPEDFAARLQDDADTFARKTQNEIRKHPERKAELETALRAHQNDLSDTQEFVKSRSLRMTSLDSAHPDAAGWVFFSARSKWIGDWRKQEQFVIRIPLEDKLVEFPFALPPSQGDLILRRRPE
jgi:hypothetical protein